MKPKEIRKWFLLLTIALSLVSSEYCSRDKTNTVKYERQGGYQNSIEKRFRENDSHSLSSKPLTHRFQSKNTKELDFVREKVFHRSDSPNSAKSIRNGIRQSIRRREIPKVLNSIPFSRSTEIRRYAVSDQRSYRKSDSDVDMLNVQNTQTSQNKAATLTLSDQAVTRKIIHKRSEKLHLKGNNNIQKDNGRYISESNRRSRKNSGERTTIFKANRINIVNNENRQEQQHNIRGGNTGAVSGERLTNKNRSSDGNKNFSEKIEKGSTKNKSFISNPVNEISRILNIRSRFYERNFNRLEHSRFHRTETINAIRGKSAVRRTEIRSTEDGRQDKASLRVTSMRLSRSRITEVPDKNNNILRKAIKAVSLATRDDPQSTLHGKLVRSIREVLMNGRYMNRNDGILRENLRRYASTGTRFQPNVKTDSSTEQNVPRISTWLPSEIVESRKSRYATYSRSDRLKVISTENRNSQRSVQDRKENTRGTDETEYSLKIDNIGRLSQERMVAQVSRNRNNINNYRFSTNRRVELKNLGDDKSTILDYGVRSHKNTRNERYLSRASHGITGKTRKDIEINIAESVTQRAIEERNDHSILRLVHRISVTSDNNYPDHSLQVKETINADERAFAFSRSRNMMYAGRGQRRQRQVEEPGKGGDVRNLERNTIFRVNERDTKQKLIQYNEERKLISRKNGMYQKLERELRRHPFSDAAQIRKDTNELKLKEDYRQSTRYYERHISDNRDDRMKAVRSRRFQLRNNGRMSTEQTTLRNIRSTNPGKITRNVPSFVRGDEHTLLKLNMQVRMRTSDRNGRGFRGKLDILRRLAINRQMKPSKENESFIRVVKSFANRLSEKTVQDRVLRTEKNNRGSKNYKLEHLSSEEEGIQDSTDRASRRIRINIFSSVRNSNKRISGEVMRERRASSGRSRRVLADQSRVIERRDERKVANLKIKDRLILAERSDLKRSVNNQNNSPMIQRNGRGFRGKETNFVRVERILKYNYNRNNLLLTVFYHKQDISLQAHVLKPVENVIRFTVPQRASRKFSFDRNTGRTRNYERAFVENQRNIRNNQRALLKNMGNINSNLNIFVAQQTPNRNVHSIHRDFQERNIPFKSYYSSNRRANDRILSLNQSASRRYDMRVERFLENSRTGSPKTRERRISEETKLDNIKQIIFNHKLSEDTILPIYGAFGSPFISKDIIFENRLISLPQMYSSQKGHLNANENWNLRTVFSLTAHIILGLSIVMAASESDPFKCRSFKQRLFDALSLRTEVF